MLISDMSLLTQNNLRDIGEYAIDLMLADFKNGIFQTKDGNSSKQNYNAQYAKYKANAGRRYTFDTKGGRVKGSKLGKSANGKYKNANKNIKSLMGVAVRNTDVSKVNMELTGHLLDGLHVETIDVNGVVISYMNEDIHKIKGNEEKYNRVIVGLNDKNKELVRNKVISMIGKDRLKEMIYMRLKTSVGGR